MIGDGVLINQMEVKWPMVKIEEVVDFDHISSKELPLWFLSEFKHDLNWCLINMLSK